MIKIHSLLPSLTSLSLQLGINSCLLFSNIRNLQSRFDFSKTRASYLSLSLSNIFQERIAARRGGSYGKQDLIKIAGRTTLQLPSTINQALSSFSPGRRGETSFQGEKSVSFEGRKNRLLVLFFNSQSFSDRRRACERARKARQGRFLHPRHSLQGP